MLQKSLNFFFCFVLTSSTVLAQQFLRTEGKAIVNELQDTVILKGMGLGGWMLQEGYMLQTAEFANAQHQIKQKISELIGSEKTQTFYDAWLANHVTKADIDSLKAWGFNSVRLPMHYNLYTLPIEEEPIAGENTWIEKGFLMTDSLISWCATNEMYVVLDLHAAPGGQGYDQGISDYDPSKPSLWESALNKKKTVDLWKRLADRYKDEAWVAGYDLLNEPNWDLPGNQALANLYKEITDSIRTVDDKHILFIEGNWFANDFTGLTPPWDDEIVYSPHKYWSVNDQASIQWVLNIRESYNVPLYLGESGENSNVWFRDAIALLEEFDIGWAWWPLKKIESISCPLSVEQTDDYNTLLDYWGGTGATPSEEFVFNTLMTLTEKLKIENCRIQPDVIDAFFRQVKSSETIPFNTQSIPGVVYATDYDIGQIGEAYYDSQSATYHVTTGDYTAWNNGWAYRNDGVDIEPCNDQVNSNGYNVGWIASGEWMQYDVDVALDGVYDIKIRYATEENSSAIHFTSGEARLTDAYILPTTGSWQSYNTFTIPNVYLSSTDRKIRFYADVGGVNISSFVFEEKDSGTNLAMRFVEATTIDEDELQVFFNKSIGQGEPKINDFAASVNGTEIDILEVGIRPDNPRIIDIHIDAELLFSDVIRISYSGINIESSDNSILLMYTDELVRNLLPPILSIPGKIEMEDFQLAEGVQLESTTDVDGGFNIGFLDGGDHLEYDVFVYNTGNYSVFSRVASEQSSGSFRARLIDRDGNSETLLTQSISSTGGWQSWQSLEKKLQLTEGRYTLRIDILNGPFNFNWIDFVYVPTEEEEQAEDGCQLCVYPNPVETALTFEVNFSQPHDLSTRIYDIYGRIVYAYEYGYNDELNVTIPLTTLAPGQYVFETIIEDGTKYRTPFIKQ